MAIPLTNAPWSSGEDFLHTDANEISDALVAIEAARVNASNLTSGTLPDGRFPATLPAASGANLTALNATNLASGTVPDARFPATLPAASGVNLTALNATNISSGTVPTARLGSGTADNTTFLRGDQSWQTVSGSGDVVGPASSVDGEVAFFDSTTGKLLKAGSTVATPQVARLGVGTAADGNSKLKIAGDYWSPTVAGGNSGTSKTLDWRDGNTQLLTMTGNCTLTLSNPQDGGRYLLVLVQSSGSHTMTWPSSVKWSAGTAPTLSTAAGKADVVTLVWVAGIGASGNYIAAANLDFTPA